MVNERKESKLFEYEIPSLSPNDEHYIDLHSMPYGKYLPFNFLMVENSSQQKIRVIINDSIRKIIFPGTIMTFDSATIPAIWSLRVVNKGTDIINQGEVIISFQKISNIKTRAFKILAGDL